MHKQSSENLILASVVNNNIVIKHGFSCINVHQVPKEMLTTKDETRSFQHLSRDLATVNALKNNV